MHYNLVRDLLTHLLGRRPASVFVNDAEEFARERAALQQAEGPRVVKTHAYIPAVEAMERRLVLYIHRDLRDAVVSFYQMYDSSFQSILRKGWVRKIVDEGRRWCSLPADRIVSYDTVRTDLGAEVRALAELFGEPVGYETAEEIGRRNSFEGRRAYLDGFDFERDGRATGQEGNRIDPGTLLHERHLASGTSRWRRELEPSQVARIEHIGGDFMRSLGYELSQPFHRRMLAAVSLRLNGVHSDGRHPADVSR